MDTYLAERTYGVRRPDGRTDLPATSAAVFGERLTWPDEWRWIPDPAEVDMPKPLPSGDTGISGALIRALAWAGLHYWD